MGPTPCLHALGALPGCDNTQAASQQPGAEGLAPANQVQELLAALKSRGSPTRLLPGPVPPRHCRYGRLVGDEDSVLWAHEVFQAVDRQRHDPVHGGYLETAEQSFPLESMGIHRSPVRAMSAARQLEACEACKLDASAFRQCWEATRGPCLGRGGGGTVTPCCACCYRRAGRRQGRQHPHPPHRGPH